MRSRAEEGWGEGAGWPLGEAGEGLMVTPKLGDFRVSYTNPLICALFCKAGDRAPGSEAPGVGEGIGRYICVLQNLKTTAGCTAIYLPTTPSQLLSPEAMTTHVTNSLCIFQSQSLNI